MKKVYKKKEEDAVSPVIATILMVAITVVLAAVLYVMVIGMGDTGSIETPLGLNQQSRTTTTVTLLIASAPNGAKVTGTQFSLSQGGTPGTITTADVYYANATLAATYTGATSSWAYFAGATADNLEFNNGMTILVEAGSISNGDVLTISSTEEFYGTTTHTVN